MSRGSGAAGHVVICLPDCLSVLMSRLEGVAPTLEEASSDLGSNPWQTFVRITLPFALAGGSSVRGSAPRAGPRPRCPCLQAGSYLGERSLHVLSSAKGGQRITVQSGPSAGEVPGTNAAELGLCGLAGADRIPPG